MNWDKRIEALKNNGFSYAGDRYILNGIDKIFWVSELKKLNDEEFERFIDDHRKEI